MCKMRNKHLRTWNMARKFKKMWKMRHTHYRTCNRARKLRNEENENLTW